jgi:hypothetical protein
MRPRNSPLSAPWMMRWSYVLVSVTILLTPISASVCGSAPSYSIG